MSYDKELARQIYNTARITGEFLLRSGATSHQYFDKYLFEANPVLLKQIAEAMAPNLPDDHIDVLAGLEMGGIPIVTMLSQTTGLPGLLCAKKQKSMAPVKLAEGGDIDGRKLVIIEDVVTSGGQIRLSAADLRERGAIVDTVLCVIDREAGGKRKVGRRWVGITAVIHHVPTRSSRPIRLIYPSADFADGHN